MAARNRNSIIAAQLSTISGGNGCYGEKANENRKNTAAEDSLMAGKRDELLKDCHQILGDKQIHNKGNMIFEDGGDEDQEEDDEASDAKGDESDLDLAWKLLVDERSIVEKQPGDTMEKVYILSALAKVALKREDVDNSLNDYLKALWMLERLAEPDNIHIAELNFGICLCLELGSKGSSFLHVLNALMVKSRGGLEMYKNGDIFWNKDVKSDLKRRDLNFVDLRTSRFSGLDVLIRTRILIPMGWETLVYSWQENC
ncbi:hypothetical protein E3N88_31342 [Mikania micrantha]|uniref:Uncharacterized protein n=1 Tax=Mikania micrantha TaxID=192012 RepID=A0A5N6MPR5_9ASTR|nr:hypothetical protein E3N88_31342 [Mikania micrantha]